VSRSTPTEPELKARWQRFAAGWHCPPKPVAGAVPELVRAVHRTLYRSTPQRALRLAAGAYLFLKHALRGMLFSWPLYLLLAAGLLAPVPEARWLLAIALPGLAVSLYILLKGVHDDYCELVHDELLRTDSFFSALRPHR
jgi:hypothetical protein